MTRDAIPGATHGSYLLAFHLALSAPSIAVAIARDRIAAGARPRRRMLRAPYLGGAILAVVATVRGSRIRVHGGSVGIDSGGVGVGVTEDKRGHGFASEE